MLCTFYCFLNLCSFAFQRDMIRERVTVSQLKADMWTVDHIGIIENFTRDTQRLLVAYIDTINGLTLEHTIPTNPVEELTYFIKCTNVEELTAENFCGNVQYGTVKKTHIESLLRLMSGIYAPLFFENTSWPDSILCTAWSSASIGAQASA